MFYNRKKNCFPPRKGHFLFVFECLPLFLLSLFWPPPFQFVLQFLPCLSLVFILPSCFFCFILVPCFFFGFFMIRTTSKYSIAISLHQSLVLISCLVFLIFWRCSFHETQGMKQGKKDDLDGQNRQSPVFSKRKQLSQTIPQFHVERRLNERTPIARFESLPNERRVCED